MAHQIHHWWHMPYSEMVGWIDACCGEVPTHIHIAATNSSLTDTRSRQTTTHTATESRPTAAVPSGYVVCRHSSCCGEATAHIHIAATDSYRVDSATPTTHTATESG